MNLTYFRPKMRGNVVNKNENLVNIRLVVKTPDIRNLTENITFDVMLKCHDPELLVKSRGSRSRTGPLFCHKG